MIIYIKVCILYSMYIHLQFIDVRYMYKTNGNNDTQYFVEFVFTGPGSDWCDDTTGKSFLTVTVL